jgi:hypothetical protein
MDKTVSMIITALSADMHSQLQGLGDFPKSDKFEHGVQVGMYRGLQAALDRVAKVLDDEAEEEKRR